MFLVNPFEKYPDEIYRTYQKFRRRNELAKAYRCLESLVKQFPDDPDLLSEIVELALDRIRDPNLARPWVMHRIRLLSYWRDYALLSEIEAATGHLTKARENLALATKLQKRQRTVADTRREIKETLDRARDFIRLQEHNQWVERISSQATVRPLIKHVKQRNALATPNIVQPAAATEENVRLNVKRLIDDAPIMSDALAAKKIAVSGGIYDLATGKVNLI
jgi:hypothetical protein